jgi:glycosyltransferase involved in cell wall biosynthesis
MRPVLIISYWFAPSPAVGGKRFSFLAREFARQGYDVHVITHETREWSDWKTDSSLPLAGHVHRCAERVKLPLTGGRFLHRLANSVLRRLLAPLGWEILWARAATRKALAVARQYRLQDGVVIATSPAHAALIAGSDVARQLGWPLILDYRDPWSAHDWPRWRRSVASQWFARRIERPLIRRSAARVLNTPAMRGAFERFFPRAERERNYVIPNGFEAAAGDPPQPSTDGPVHIVHAGEIFKGRSLLPVLEAAARLESRFPERPILVTTFGELPVPEQERIRAAGLERFVEVRPRIPFKELFVELQRAHLLLAIVGDHMVYSTPYKVYDYMSVGRPILGIAPRGAALFELLADSGAGECFEVGDRAGIERALETFMRGESAPRQARVDRFRWTNLALQYRQVIEAAAGSSAPAPLRSEVRAGSVRAVVHK